MLDSVHWFSPKEDLVPGHCFGLAVLDGPRLCSLSSRFCCTTLGRRPGAESGGTKKFFRCPNSGKMFIFRVKIWDNLFFSHRLGSSDFLFLFSHFPYVYYVKCRI